MADEPQTDALVDDAALAVMESRARSNSGPAFGFTAEVCRDVLSCVATIRSLRAERDRWYDAYDAKQKEIGDIGNMPAIVKSVDYGAETLAQCVEMAIDRHRQLGKDEGARLTRNKVVELIEGRADGLSRTSIAAEQNAHAISELRELAKQIKEMGQ